ncbi:chemosensory receptor A [Elysia marginata]|uniref:Chemosensory receptor A n=1 Tax=Elysia marginata TaxID=1093978 RepID=A0AAV4IDJ5_9GAST|nr:chemosensory receptor A [Elysia marginata]
MNESLELFSTQAPKDTVPYLKDEYFMVMTGLSYIWPFIFLCGFVSNPINIAVFLKTGANDNVTILLIALACSDLTFLTLISPYVGGFMHFALVRGRPWTFDPKLLLYTLFWPATTAYDVSCFFAVSLSVTRCACVAMPLKFKLVFTKSRTIKWALFVVVLAVLLRLPVLLIYRIAWRTDPVTNVSTMYTAIWKRDQMMRINDILNRNVVMYLAYITMVACVLVLSAKLYQASKIRQSCTVKGTQPSEQTPGKPAAQGLSARDLQVVKSVVLVCSIFIFAQLPFMVYSTVRLINPEFDENKQFAYLSYIMNHLSLTCYYTSASMNIFVYYNFNSRFRSVLLSQLCGKTTQK